LEHAKDVNGILKSPLCIQYRDTEPSFTSLREIWAKFGISSRQTDTCRRLRLRAVALRSFKLLWYSSGEYHFRVFIKLKLVGWFSVKFWTTECLWYDHHHIHHIPEMVESGPQIYEFYALITFQVILYLPFAWRPTDNLTFAVFMMCKFCHSQIKRLTRVSSFFTFIRFSSLPRHPRHGAIHAFTRRRRRQSATLYVYCVHTVRTRNIVSADELWMSNCSIAKQKYRNVCSVIFMVSASVKLDNPNYFRPEFQTILKVVTLGQYTDEIFTKYMAGTEDL
jgi:hypothetical protein